MFTRTDLNNAHAALAPHMSATPQYRWPGLQEALGCEVWLKHENHTPTGAFKVRGGLYFMQRLMRQDQPPQSLITATRGNHGQSIPFAARLAGIPVTVLVPQGNSLEKNASMRGWGADLVEFGTDFDEARCEAERRSRADNAMLVPSFHPDLVTGVATYLDELFRAAGELDRVYVPIGMGSGACATILVSTFADAMARSLRSGAIETTATAATFADGVACRVPHPDAFAVIRKGLSRIVSVTDVEVAEAMRLIYRTTHNVAEGAGAAACAAAWQERDSLAGKRIGIALTGGNVDTAVFAEVLAGGTPKG